MSTRRNFKQALNQLEKIRKDDVANLSITAKSVAKIALMVVPFYQSSKDKKTLSAFNKDEVEEFFSTFTNEFKPVTNWSCAWLLHHEFQEKPMEFENRFELYQGVGIVAMVKPV